MIKFNVSLSNQSCIFDAENGFRSVEDALDWASGRGGSYNVELTKEIDGVEQFPDLMLRATQRGRTTTFAVDDIHSFRPVSIDWIKAVI